MFLLSRKLVWQILKISRIFFKKSDEAKKLWGKSENFREIFKICQTNFFDKRNIFDFSSRRFFDFMVFAFFQF